MTDERKWIVVWTSEVTLWTKDYWQVFEDFKEAEEFYENKWKEHDTATASLTRILKSSDYNGELENNDE